MVFSLGPIGLDVPVMAVHPKVGQVYWVKWKARDIGYGVERGSDEYVYRGREPIGKMQFERADDGQMVYLFDDEIVYCEREY